MSGDEAFNSGWKRGNPSSTNDESGSKLTKRTLDESFFRLAKTLEEAEIHVSTTKVYLSAAKNAIDTLKSHLTHAEVDMKTANECVMKTDARLRNLRAELQCMFSRTFYQNLDSDRDGAATINSEHSTVMSADGILAPDLQVRVSSAFRKYTESNNINPGNYRTSYELHGGLIFVVVHPKSNENSLGNRASDFQRDASKTPRLQAFSDKLPIVESETIDSDSQGIPYEKTGDESNFIEDRNSTSKTFVKQRYSQREPTPQGFNSHMHVNIDKTSAIQRESNRSIGACEEQNFAPTVRGIKSPYASGVKSNQTTAAQNFEKQRLKSNRIPGGVFQSGNNLPSSNSWPNSGVMFPNKQNAPNAKRATEQVEDIPVKIHSSDSEDGYETFSKETRDKWSRQNNKSENLIKISSSDSSGNAGLTLEDCKYNSDNKRMVHKGVNTATLKYGPHNADLLCDVETILEDFEPPSSLNEFQRNSAASRCRSKTLSQSLVNKDNSHNDLSTREVQEYDHKRDSSFANTEERTKKILSIDDFGVAPSSLEGRSDSYDVKVGCHCNENNRLDQVKVSDRIGLSGSCYSHELGPRKRDGTKQFHTPQCRSRRHTLTNDNFLEGNFADLTFHLGAYPKRPESLPVLTESKISEPKQKNNSTLEDKLFHSCYSLFRSYFLSDEKASCDKTLSEISRDADRNRSNSRTFSNSPSYASFMDDVMRQKYDQETSDYDVASCSTAIDMSFDSETERSSHITTYDETPSPPNVDTSGSICIHLLEESTTDRSPTPLTETCTAFEGSCNPLQNLSIRNPTESNVFQHPTKISQVELNYGMAEQCNSTMEDSSNIIEGFHQQKKNSHYIYYPNSKSFITRHFSRNTPKPDYSP